VLPETKPDKTDGHVDSIFATNAFNDKISCDIASKLSKELCYPFLLLLPGKHSLCRRVCMIAPLSRQTLPPGLRAPPQPSSCTMMRVRWISSRSNWTAAAALADATSGASTWPRISPFVAKQDDAPTALHPAGELLGAVFLAGTAGLHGANLRGRSEESSHHLNAKTVNISLVQLAVEPTAHG